MNALMGSVYCEECSTGCPCGSRFDIITQICQGQRALLLSVLHNCRYHLHGHRYSDINVLLHGRRRISKPPHANNDGTFYVVRTYRMKLMRNNDDRIKCCLRGPRHDRLCFWDHKKWPCQASQSGLRGTLPSSDAGCSELPGVSQCEGSYQQGRQRKQLHDEMFFWITAGLQVLWGWGGNTKEMACIMFKCIQLQINKPALRGWEAELMIFVKWLTVIWPSNSSDGDGDYPTRSSNYYKIW